MNELERVTLYNTILNSRTISCSYDYDDEDDEICDCCFCLNEKWCFNHVNINGFKQYDKNTNNCCTCLDCCTWCLEFKFQNTQLCVKPTNIYLCCCVIYFI